MTKYFEINESGHNIRCKIFTKDLHQMKRLVIFVHGFAGHKDNASTEKFADRVLTKYKNIGVLIYDQPAHGDDVKRQLQLSDCITYLEIVLTEAKKRFRPEQIYGFGISFGCYALMNYLKDRGNPFEKIILRSPAINMFESLTGKIITESEMEILKAGKPVKVGFDRKVEITKAFLDDLAANDILKNDYLDFADDIEMILGTNDEVISFETAKHFSEENCIELISVAGADHRFQNPKYMEEVIKETIRFFGF